jgi:hypothetical protein
MTTIKQIADKYCGRKQPAIIREINHPAINSRADARREAEKLVEKLKESKDFDFGIKAELDRMIRGYVA